MNCFNRKKNLLLGLTVSLFITYPVSAQGLWGLIKDTARGVVDTTKDVVDHVDSTVEDVVDDVTSPSYQPRRSYSNESTGSGSGSSSSISTSPNNPNSNSQMPVMSNPGYHRSTGNARAGYVPPPSNTTVTNANLQSSSKTVTIGEFPKALPGAGEMYKVPVAPGLPTTDRLRAQY